jgi:hypothetical protein
MNYLIAGLTKREGSNVCWPLEIKCQFATIGYNRPQEIISIIDNSCSSWPE